MAPRDPWEFLDHSFERRFSAQPTIHVRAPGRVNLIGEHTDYNDGLVLPAAVDRHVRIAAGPNHRTNRIRLFASAYDTPAEFQTRDPGEDPVPTWARYAQGVAVKLARGIRLAGVDAVIGGDLPIGSGLSSSAALEIAVSMVLEEASGTRLDPRARALLCHDAEVGFVGVPCGIMDQFAVSLCRRGHALFLDCRSQETHHLPLPYGLILAVCDTGVQRNLGDSGYATRRQECLEALRALGEQGRPVQSLRDLTPDDLETVEGLPEPLNRRARHVVTENARVIDTARALEGGATEQLREIFLASHRSLRDDYEVSCRELDAMVDAALESPGCMGARMTGAGFGGAVVALVRRDQQDEFRRAISQAYRRRAERAGRVFTTEAAEGARVEDAGRAG